MAPYEEILKGKYPGKLHAKKVVQYIRSKIPDATGVIYVEAKKAKLHEDCDQEEHFRQRRSFFYLTGCHLPDCHYTYDIATEKATLYIPPIDAESVVWSGLPLSTAEALEEYDVDHVEYTTDTNGSLSNLASSTKTVFAIPGQVSDNITFLGFDTKNLDILKEAIEYSRAIKTPYEIALIQKASNISSVGHKAVMQTVKRAENEAELHAAFLSNCVSKGAKNMAYDVIAASGRAAATLHYVRNDQPLSGKLNLLLDAGCELDCYASDITRTFPISGKFSPESRAIYDIVLRMQNESIGMLKEGVRWDDVHEHAHRVAIDGLLGLGILKGDKEEIFKSRTSVAFFPHGLGHYLGMDTHDTGGDPNYADKDTMFRYLRKRGTLPTGAVITVEPGIYFCKFIIDPALKDPATAKYIDVDVLEKYWDVGGVRIEDNVVITPTGVENLTSVVKDADELEKLISSS
ncbi:hypothetical protein N0V93_005407 [Gnomoniopsis smithogilvyi]|uniref:Xaa-Pro aminopeptidase n=1 Tax=Gnomoniopsis smithogilvyi TaxID=1191159 RepID=A0A9W9CWQ2_9PEZI|nr:hypothetical protein N0V93_005407 [Gnomoniopsis smithogilvyi]